MLCFPKKIQFDEKNLMILWSDAQETRHPLLALRKNCPCALCRGGHELQSKRTTDSITEIKLNRWEQVGRYAIRMFWSDNHDDGIYTFDSLRIETVKNS